MSKLAILHQKDYKHSVWKNGLGFTNEIAIYPPTASLVQGNFSWRLSSARIEKASPFSTFPHHDRVLVILKGAGMKLTHTFEEGGDEETVDLPPLEPYEFPGDVPSSCALLDGPVVDFSVFVRKGEVEPQVEIVEIEEGDSFPWSPQGRWNFVFAVNGKFQTPAGELNEGCTLVHEAEGPNSQELEIQAQISGQILLVSLS